MTKKIVLLILVFLFTTVSSQKRTYEISFCGRDQKVILTEKNNKKFSGIIQAKFQKQKSNREIIKTKKINNDIAKVIVNNLKIKGILELKNRDDKIDCGDFYLDGDILNFIIIENKIILNKGFDEVYPENETKTIETNECRRKAQILATIIDKHLNLKQIHSKQFKKLGSGTCYWTGISQICIKKK